MTNWHDSRTFRLALAFAMVLSMLLPPAGHSASHDPAALALAEIERHAALATEDDDHSHSHHDGWLKERHSGHSHGHDPADHSHDVPVPADLAGYAVPVFGSSWHVPALASHDRGPPFGIERPPRSS